MVVHPGNGNWDGTLANALLHHAPQLAGVARAGIVHRLDKDTTGLLVVAKTDTAQTDLVRQLQARSVRREYLALAAGDIVRGGRIDAPIGRHPVKRTSMAIVAAGKHAVTHYEVRERFGDSTLVLCRLETGRTHQIRVHLASIGHPLIGDRGYGRGPRVARGGGRVVHRQASDVPVFPRQALHAHRLGLVHPVTRQTMTWESPLPDDLSALLDALRQRKTV
jgi:23S rRNA pseudouridine1911/1915/1917 synthase